jgi:ketosteroid isomerase-like protein
VTLGLPVTTWTGYPVCGGASWSHRTARPASRCTKDGKKPLASGDFARGDHAELSVPEVADRLAIRELVDAYAFCADRRDAARQMALFTDDTDFLVYMDSRNPSPTQHLRGRAALKPVFDELNTYEATMHFNGQSTVVLDGDHASGVTYCMAHHVTVDGSVRRLMVAAIRYLDTFVKHDGAWFFSQRKLMVDWTETRPLATG